MCRSFARSCTSSSRGRTASEIPNGNIRRERQFRTSSDFRSSLPIWRACGFFRAADWNSCWWERTGLGSKVPAEPTLHRGWYKRRWTGSWQRWSVTKTRICTCCMRSTNSISFVTTATKHSCTTRLRELRDLSSLPSHREWPTCLPMTTESSIAYSFSIRTTLERFCRSFRFELGNRLHCKSGALESADAKREVVCELLRPQELSLPLAVLLNTRICIANFGAFCKQSKALIFNSLRWPSKRQRLDKKSVLGRIGNR